MRRLRMTPAARRRFVSDARGPSPDGIAFIEELREMYERVGSSGMAEAAARCADDPWLAEIFTRLSRSRPSGVAAWIREVRAARVSLAESGARTRVAVTSFADGAPPRSRRPPRG